MKKLFLLPLLSFFVAGAASANWQYAGTYVNDGWYQDTGSRLTLSFRGGLSIGAASMQNDVGTLSVPYYYTDDGDIIPDYWCDGDCVSLAGVAELADVPVSAEYSSLSFAAGASVGFTLPNKPQWRFEIGWDHIAETDYTESPLFEGEVELADTNISVFIQSGGVQSSVSTDVISAMAFYDFYDGLVKPLGEFIPYIGAGVGYANSETVLNLSDLYGDLSSSVDLLNFGDMDDYYIVQFYTSEQTSSSIAGLLAAGFSYGIDEYTFFDFGARLMYVPQIKWSLVNSDETRTRDWFSADGALYMNFMAGVRFEF